jgi:hypothetical protein
VRELEKTIQNLEKEPESAKSLNDKTEQKFIQTKSKKLYFEQKLNETKFKKTILNSNLRK